jgi:hypothetical protein
MSIDPERVVLPGLVAGGSGLVCFTAGVVLAPPVAVRSWLVAALFFLGLSLGALIVLMIHNLTGGRWGDLIRPQLLAMMSALPWTLLAMAVPLVRPADILGWTTSAPAALPPAVRAKLGYFAPFFLSARTIIALVLWVVIALAIATRPQRSSEARTWSIAGLIVVMVTTLFFTTDWMLAPEPEFYSTIYAVLELSGEVVGAFALAILVLFLLGGLDRQPAVDRDTLISEDVANLFFGFILLWVYLAFMQWLIVWSGDLSDEIGWYLRRGSGVWLVLLIALLILHFAIPFAALLSRRVKRSPAALAVVAAIVLGGHLVDVIWRLAPPMVSGLAGGTIAVASFAAIGGVWVAGVAWELGGRPSAARWRGGANV